MADTVRWGILGASRFAAAHMAPAIHGAHGAKLVALGTRDPKRSGPFRTLVPEIVVHDSYDAVIRDSQVDAVYIPLPNAAHVEWTVKALAEHKAVLVEKPAAMKQDEYDDLITARDAAATLAAEAFMIVHHPQWQRARELVREGSIGKLVHVGGAFSFMNRDLDDIRNQSTTGGGALPDIGVYVFGSARFVTGEEPERIVSAVIERHNGVDTFAQTVAAFPSFTYAAHVSMRAFPRQEMVFHGEKGVIRLTAPFNAGIFGQAELSLERDGMEVVTQRWPGLNQYVAQVEAFGRALRGEEEYMCPLEFSRGTQAMIDDVYAAAS